MEAKPERLQKILAAAGLASRRKAEELIAAGVVSVNGQTVTEPGTKADPRLDEIRVDGKLLRGPERHVYLAMYKPKGHMTTVSDPEGRPTVMDILKGVEERVFPVGRLDYMSEGLLLLTNDGDLMAQLTRAGAHVAKTYMVKVSGMPTEEALDKLRNGIMLPPEPGLAGARGKKQPGVERRSFAVLTQPAVIQLAVDQENPWFEVTLTEGRNRQLRRMFEQVGHHIEKIKRVRYGSLTLDLEPGEFRHLTPKEVTQLRKSLDTPFKPKLLKVKRKDDRPERKPRIDTARFVKGRRGKPSADAPATAPAPIVRRVSASSARDAYGATPPRRPFAAREDRGAASGSARPRGPEFTRSTRPDEGSKRPYTRKPAAEFAAKPSGDFEDRPKRVYTRKPEGSFDRKPSDRNSGGFDRKPASFARKPADGGPRREGAFPKRASAKREGGFSGAPEKRTTNRTTAPGADFSFGKFAKPKFVKPSKHRDLGSDKTAGFVERKPFGDRPPSRERGPGSDRGFSDKPAFGAKPGGFSGGRKYSKGPGKPMGSDARTGSDFKRPSGEFKRPGSDFKRPGGEFKRGGESRPGGRGADAGKGFGARRPGSAPPRSGGGDFKRPGAGALRRPSTPARGGGASRPPRRPREE
jgi:23S rRNA pseudouridine2605 synthase